MPASDAIPTLVLDTNAVLDWLLFRDPGMAACAAAVESGRLRWIACPRMREELAATLCKPGLAGRGVESEHVLAQFDRYVVLAPEPCTPPAGHPMCSDPDDQVFVDLALAHGARWLLSHDRALLRLARAARSRDLLICAPSGWQPNPTA